MAKIIENSPLKRAPFRLSGSSAILGDILEVQTKHERFVWNKNPMMLWDPVAKVVYWSNVAKVLPRNSVLDSSDNAYDVYEMWHDDRPHEIKLIVLPDEKTWERLGDPKRIDYGSDREGPWREYTHAIDHPARFYRFGETGKWVYAIKGLQISDRGFI